MAISASGQLPMGTIQSEFGGSHPISLSEYYSGSIAGNTTSITITPTINGGSNSFLVNYGSAEKPNNHTTTANNFGFMDSSLSVNTNPNVGQGSYTTSAIRSGVDKTGNAGAIPSSGTISFDHFRGTDAGTTTTKVIYGITYNTSVSTFNNISSSFIRVWFQGHLGTNNQGNVSWDGLPFSSMVLSSIGSPAIPQTTLTFSGTQTTNGGVQTKYLKTHQSNSTLGNFTQCIWYAAAATYRHSTSNATWSITCNV
tara:strand:+ start:1850 stop:2611 length:762 start_codon:yes stop_codon:yes gene_type:complete